MSRPVQLAIVAFLASIAYWPGLMSSAVAPRWWLVMLAQPLLFSRVELRRLPKTMWVALAATIVAAWVSLFWTPEPVPSAFEAFQLSAFIIWIIIGTSIDSVELPMLMASIGGAISAGVAVAQAVGVSPFTGSILEPSALRPTGLFWNPEVLGESLAPLAVWAILGRRWAIAVALGVGVALSGSRIGIGAAAIALAWSSGWRWGATTVAIGAAAIVAIGVIDPGKLDSAWKRLELWELAIAQSTWLGSGIGAWASSHHNLFEDFVHSDAFQLVMELGVFSIPLISFIALASIQAKRGPIGGAYVCLLIEAVVSFPLHLPFTQFIFGILTGYMVRYHANPCCEKSWGRADHYEIGTIRSFSAPVGGFGRSGLSPLSVGSSHRLPCGCDRDGSMQSGVSTEGGLPCR